MFLELFLFLANFLLLEVAKDILRGFGQGIQEKDRSLSPNTGIPKRTWIWVCLHLAFPQLG